ncbi:conserved hypothetical protein [Gluconacetobacter diazotrophicus PA1 5]|nr:conserved hypothetical protein [Gluconacetobacter diazotrophicus PA1 5]TWB08634.1 hypothetical protein FBZ86_106132 [Gluconacetobacter diazotrophicus]
MPGETLTVTTILAGRLPALFLSCGLVSVAASAMAQDAPAHGPAAQVQRQVAVLQSNPNGVSRDCLDALAEVHKTQDTISAEEDRSKDPDLDVARDVLETDLETAVQSCRADTTSICDKAGADPKLAKACAALDQSEADPKADQD